MSVTLETKVWEGDWELVLKTNHLAKLVKACGPSVERRVLAINNVKDRISVERVASDAIRRGLIDEYFLVADTETEVLRHFGLARKDFGRGYYYSIAELTGIYRATTPYVLHFSSDSMPASPKEGWLEDFIRMMGSRQDVSVANLSWTPRLTDVGQDAFSEDADFLYGAGFSDQMYLVRTAEFRRQIYAEFHETSRLYPDYADELFEKRVNSWMRNHNRLRATYRHGRYQHANHTRSPVAKTIAVLARDPYVASPDRWIRDLTFSVRRLVGKSH